MKPLLFFLFLVPVLGWAKTAPDPMEDLIEEQQKSGSDWMEEIQRAELPPVFLVGSKEQVLIKGTGFNKERTGLCDSLEVDELIDLSHGSTTADQFKVNVSLKPAKQALEDGCLIRPDDDLVAVTRGSIQPIHVGAFWVKNEALKCPREVSSSLWMEVEPPLKEEPLFFTTISGLEPMANRYAPASSFTTRPPDDALKEKLRTAIRFIGDFNVSVYEVGDPSLDIIVWLKRVRTEPEDDKLPNEMILGRRGPDLYKVWEEPVDVKNGSGSLVFGSVFDFNNDGLLDLELNGVQGDCPYTLFFRAESKGWTPLATPLPKCQCGQDIDPLFWKR